MRRLAYGLAALGLLAIPPCAQAAQCTNQAEQSMFEVAALKSELMVLATGCQDQSQYNNFVLRYRPSLLHNDAQLKEYFKRVYGRRAQQMQDAFVTSLANAQSSQGTSLGSDFCPRNSVMFHEVMALKSTGQLPDYAAGKDLVPARLDLCTAEAHPAVVKARAVVHRKSRTKKKH